MLFLARWKVVVVVLVCAAGVAFSAPNFVSREVAESLPAWLPHKQVNLGLDLQGGSHLLIEVEVEAAVQERLQILADEIRATLREKRIGYESLTAAEGVIALELRDGEQRTPAIEAIRGLNGQLSVSALGGDLDVASPTGGRIAVRLSEAAVRDRARAAVDQSIEIVRRRVDEIGTREPTIQRQGQSRILVQLPGEHAPDRVRRLLGKTAKLSFHLVDDSVSPEDAAAGRLPQGYEVLEADPQSGERTGSRVVQKRALVSGDALVDAQAAFERGQAAVSFRFDPLGARQFGEATRENVGRPFAIVLDRKVISAPVIREPILGGAGVISGRFSVQEANDLAMLLRAGALPAPLRIVEERTVGPALGADSIRAGSIASVIGLLLVVAVMVTAYGLFGVISALGLVVNMALIFAALSLLQATLTLPGIAGIVLTIGMAVDGNVLIFERIREEARVGRPPIAAMEAGFVRASTTILDSNVTTLIAAVLLYLMGSGPVKGFAVTLAIGVVTSVFTAVTFMRWVMSSWLKRARPAALPI